MKAAACYYSYHHGNTLKVLQAMAEGTDLELIDVAHCDHADLAPYDVVGFASGIYGFSFHEKVVTFLKENLPQGKPVFFVYTYGGAKGSGSKAIAKEA